MVDRFVASCEADCELAMAGDMAVAFEAVADQVLDGGCFGSGQLESFRLGEKGAEEGYCGDAVGAVTVGDEELGHVDVPSSYVDVDGCSGKSF